MIEEGIAEFFTDESVLKFVNGEEVKGAKEVSDVIMKCCKEYNAGYMRGLTTSVARYGLYGIAIGIVGGASVLAISKYMKSKKQPVELNLTQNKEKEEEAE